MSAAITHSMALPAILLDLIGVVVRPSLEKLFRPAARS
jgi:hypothetical protein